MEDRYAEPLAALERAALAGFSPKASSLLDAYVEKVRHRAYEIVDADVDRLRMSGLSEDEIFEATVAAAVGEGLSRLRAARRALAGP